MECATAPKRGSGNGAPSVCRSNGALHSPSTVKHMGRTLQGVSLRRGVDFCRESEKSTAHYPFGTDWLLCRQYPEAALCLLLAWALLSVGCRECSLRDSTLHDFISCETGASLCFAYIGRLCCFRWAVSAAPQCVHPRCSRCRGSA